MKAKDRSTEEAPWYAQWFDRSEYETVYAARNDSEAVSMIDCILSTTKLEPGSSVLDVACGRGRHARSFARRGHHVTGIDLSPRAIATAQRIAKQDGLEIRFEEGDMLVARCTDCFDLVTNLFTSFGYFEEDDDHLRAIAAMAEAMKPDGWLVQDFMNVDQVLADLVPVDERREGSLRVVQKRWVEGPRLNKEITLKQAGVQTQTFRESVRLLRLQDFQKMYDRVGLKIEHVVGDAQGGSFTADSPRLIMFARSK